MDKDAGMGSSCNHQKGKSDRKALGRILQSMPDPPPPLIHQYHLPDRMLDCLPRYQRLTPISCQGTLSSYEEKSRANDASMGRPLGQLFASSDILSGEEGVKLRVYCSTACMNPDRDLKDPYGVLFKDGSLTAFQEHFQGRVEHFDGKRHEAAQELFKIKWGPTRISVYVVLLAFTRVNPELRYKYISIAEWLVDTAKVPVDGMF